MIYEFKGNTLSLLLSVLVQKLGVIILCMSELGMYLT